MNVYYYAKSYTFSTHKKVTESKPENTKLVNNESKVPEKLKMESDFQPKIKQQKTNK